MSGQYPPHDGRGPYPSSSPYADPFGDTQQASHGQREDNFSQGSYGGAHLGGDLSGRGAGPQRYSLSDTPSYQGSTQTLPTASSYSLAEEKSYDGGYHGQDDDDEARPLRDGYNGGAGGFYRPEGQE
jgi:hypothetical protein